MLFLLLVVGLLRTHALGRTSPHAVLLPCVCALCFDALTVAWRCGRVYGLGGLLQDDEFAGFRSSMLLFVNGKKIELADVQPEVTLLAFLRSLGLSGTKLGCGEGGCGACTVMVSSFEHGRVVHRSVNACLAPLCSVDSCAVTTVEGIGGTRRGAGGLHPVQERIAKMHGSQCGFCTPGIVMALYTFLRNNPRPTASQIEDSMDGNLCRCTGACQVFGACRQRACLAAWCWVLTPCGVVWCGVVPPCVRVPPHPGRRQDLRHGHAGLLRRPWWLWLLHERGQGERGRQGCGGCGPHRLLPGGVHDHFQAGIGLPCKGVCGRGCVAVAVYLSPCGRYLWWLRSSIRSSFIPGLVADL